MSATADAALGRRIALLRQGNAQAQQALTDLLARFPDHAAGWDRLGQVLAEAGKRDAALVCYRLAASTAPTTVLFLRCGLLLRELGRPREAMVALQSACAHDPGSARARFLLGVAAQDAGDEAAAIAAYQAALTLDPALAEAAVNLGTVLQETGDLDGAKAAYGRAVRQRADTFGRVAQALSMAPRGELWLDLGALRTDLGG